MSWITLKTNWQPNDYLNFDDLNAIEQDTKYLLDTLNLLPYYIPAQTNKVNWQLTDMPTILDIRRVCFNVKDIADHYYKPPKYARLTQIPTKKCLDNTDVNDLSECLVWIYEKLGTNHNTHESLKNKPFTHEQLRAFTHEQLQYDGQIIAP